VQAGIPIAVAGLVATAIAVGIGRFAFTPILPMMQHDAGVSLAAGGWLASANYVGYLLGALIPLAIRMPAAGSIRAGLLIIGVATLAMGLSEDFAVWIVLRALAGVACAWVLIFAFAWCLERLAPLRRPVLGALVFAGVGAGIAAVGALCIVLMRAQASSAQAWVFFGTLSLAFSAAIWPIFGAVGHGASGAVDRSLAGASAWSIEWNRLIFCFGVCGFGYIIPATFLPVMARQAVHDPLIFGLSWPIFGVAVLVSTLMAAFLSTAVGGARLWMASQLVMAIGVVLPVFWPGIVGIVFAALSAGGTFMVITMLAMQEARRVAAPHPERLMAAMTSAFALGQIAGPISVSLVVDDDGKFSSALFAAGFMLSVGAWVLGRRSVAAA
jgi:MFS family permease